MGLKHYREKRRFSCTSEPRGAKRANSSTEAGGRTFVVQKHQARRLHYDFRLELNGVLLSWALPKGPSLSPRQKRLAVHVEDHPLEYADFEGVIPEGEYGAGTVLVWDRGRWMEDSDPVEGLRKGELKFRLEGQKLHGGWTLVRMNGRVPRDGKENWLLIKRKDEDADLSGKRDVLEESPESVSTGRSLEAIRESFEARDRPPKEQQPERKVAAPKRAVRKSRKRSSSKDEPPDRTAEIAGVTLTHPHRVLYAAQGITKEELARYFEEIADWILPHLARRPLTLLRCPEGHHRDCFYQKHAIDELSEQVSRVRIREKSRTATYLAVDSLAGIVSLVQFGVIELHTWGSRTDELERPDRMVFDLDPGPDVSWSQVVEAAFGLRKRLEDLGLAAFLKTSGNKGLHVEVPILRRHDWNEVKAFSKAIADDLVREAAGRYTTQLAKSRRRGKIFIDYLRNGRGATVVAPYSPRARSGAPVATPLAWTELSSELGPDSFNVRTIPSRLSRLPSDPWNDYERSARSLTVA